MKYRIYDTKVEPVSLEDKRLLHVPSSEVRISTNLRRYLTEVPPRVGDYIFFDMPYKIVKLWYSPNEDTVEMWIAHDLGWRERPVLVDENMSFMFDKPTMI
jgi:hypothetical protein